MNKSDISEVIDAADAIANAKAMVWAVFHIASGMRQDELSGAIQACCSQAIEQLDSSANGLDALAGAAARDQQDD